MFYLFSKVLNTFENPPKSGRNLIIVCVFRQLLVDRLQTTALRHKKTVSNLIMGTNGAFTTDTTT